MHIILILFACTALTVSAMQAQILDTIVVSSNVPVAIPDGPGGSVESYVFLGVNRVVLDVDVTVTITHTFDQDLRLYLEHPNGADVVILAYECGGSGNNYTNTCFDDSAEVDICDDDPPFTGTFRPYHPLNLVNATHSWGTWVFRVADDYAHDVGTIDAWQIEFVLGQILPADEPPVHSLPRLLTVEQNYPNPFNATTMLPFELAHEGVVTITVVDGLGRQVKQNEQFWSAGRHLLQIDGSAWSSGTYFATLVAQHQSETVRLLLVK